MKPTKLRLFLLVLVGVVSTTGWAEEADLDWLASNKRFSDIIGLSLTRLTSSGCAAECQAKALRNTARASLLMGDYEGAKLFIERAHTKQTSPLNLALMVYVGVLHRDQPLYERYLETLTRLEPAQKEKYAVIAAIDGPKPYSEESLKVLAKAAATTQDERLRTQLREYRDRSYKSPALAGALSLVPGGGFAYLGMWQSAATSLFLTSLGAWATHDLSRKGMPGAAAAAGAITSVFYVGGVLSSVKSAHDINIKKSQPAREAIRASLLPELRFEF